jgi:hypothetical protein
MAMTKKWHGGDAGHSTKAKTAQEQGGTLPRFIWSIRKDIVKNRLVLSTVSFILACLIMATPIVMLFALDAMPNTFFWGIPIGILLGGLSWIYLYRNWDPVDLSFKKAETANQKKWITAFIVFLVILRTILKTYTEDGVILLSSVLLFWLLSTGFYMIFRAWWHHLE